MEEKESARDLRPLKPWPGQTFNQETTARKKTVKKKERIATRGRYSWDKKTGRDYPPGSYSRSR